MMPQICTRSVATEFGKPGPCTFCRRFVPLASLIVFAAFCAAPSKARHFTPLLASAHGARIAGSGAIVYALHGDLYVRDLARGETRRLTHDGRNSAPKWSPSGRWISFRKARYKSNPKPCPCPPSDDREFLWIMRRDGSGARKVRTIPEGGTFDGSFAAWSARGELAFREGNRLIGIEPESGRRRVVGAATMPDTTLGDFAWSTDGSAITYVTQTRKVAISDRESWMPSSRGNFACVIWRADCLGRHKRRVFRTRDEAGLFLWGWSPDGKRILFAAEHYTEESSYFGAVPLSADGLPLWSVSSAGGPARLLNESAQQADRAGYRAGDLLHGMTFAPMAPYIVTATGDDRHHDYDKWLLRIDLRTGRHKRLADMGAHAPTYSPDGAHIAYLVSSDTEDSGVPWIMDADGTHKRRVSGVRPGDDCGPAIWLSPRALIFEADAGEFTARLVVAGLNESRREVVSEIDSSEWDVWTAKQHGAGRMIDTPSDML